ncbi:MAG TPA: XRE family transcriptional regulator [Candidatus Binatia bacterium]|jgi:transcriptional regulator with XRE-family HTH domain
MEIRERIAATLRALRARRGYSLEQLAGRSGVSRSMISLVERAESDPTAVVLSRLADGLGVPLAALLADEAPGPAPSPLSQRANQVVWKDPESGYLRRSISPPGFASPLAIAEVTFPPGRRVSFDNIARGSAVDQQVWMLEGAMEVIVGDSTFVLHEGDCLAMRLDRPTTFRNASRRSARYAVVVAGDGGNP